MNSKQRNQIHEFRLNTMNSYIWIRILMNSYMNSESIHLNSYTWIHILMNSYVHFIYEYNSIHMYMNSCNHFMHEFIGRRFAAALLPRLFGSNPRSHHKGATGRVRTGDQQLPGLCHCQLASRTRSPLHYDYMNSYVYKFIINSYIWIHIWIYVNEFIHKFM